MEKKYLYQVEGRDYKSVNVVADNQTVAVSIAKEQFGDNCIPEQLSVKYIGEVFVQTTKMK